MNREEMGWIALAFAVGALTLALSSGCTVHLSGQDLRLDDLTTRVQQLEHGKADAGAVQQALTSIQQQVQAQAPKAQSEPPKGKP